MTEPIPGRRVFIRKIPESYGFQIGDSVAVRISVLDESCPDGHYSTKGSCLPMASRRAVKQFASEVSASARLHPSSATATPTCGTNMCAPRISIRWLWTSASLLGFSFDKISTHCAFAPRSTWTSGCLSFAEAVVGLIFEEVYVAMVRFHLELRAPMSLGWVWGMRTIF